MNDILNILAEPEDTRPQVEIALDYLEEEEAEAMLAALQNKLFPSKQLHTAFNTVGVLRDKGLVPSTDNISKYRVRRGWK